MYYYTMYFEVGVGLLRTLFWSMLSVHYPYRYSSFRMREYGDSCFVDLPSPYA
jgi:hypothetical protein